MQAAGGALGNLGLWLSTQQLEPDQSGTEQETWEHDIAATALPHHVACALSLPFSLAHSLHRACAARGFQPKQGRFFGKPEEASD